MNRSIEQMHTPFSYLDCLECSQCAQHYDAEQLQTTSPCCERPLLAKYKLEELARDLTIEQLSRREATMWRYHELLPVRKADVRLTLGEGMTPLLAMPRLAPEGINGAAQLLVKDEGLNPTGSFKARGMAVAVSRAK